MKILAFAATNSRQSINKSLANYAAHLVSDDVELLDLNEFEMPIYSVDREQEIGIPEQAQRFFNKIQQADALVIAFAEHNGSYSAAYKNIFDWASRINMKVYQNKPAVLLATSPGPGGAQSVLASAVNSAPYFALDVKGSLSVPSFFENFDSTTQSIINAELQAQLKQTLAGLNRF